MSRVGRALRTMAVLAAVGVTLAGCGGGKAAAPPPSSPTTTRSTASTTTTPPTPATPANMEGAGATVKAFMDSRVGEAGAEGYLTDDAKAVYLGQIKLYDVVSYTTGAPDGTDQRAITIPVTIVSRTGSSRTENLVVGPGSTDTVPRLPYIIRGASVSS